MKIRFANQYLKDFTQLSRDEQRAAIDTLAFFRDEPKHDSLRNHALEGRLKGCRSISADDDLRIILRVHGDYSEVTLIAVGPHQRVYRR